MLLDTQVSNNEIHFFWKTCISTLKPWERKVATKSKIAAAARRNDATILYYTLNLKPNFPATQGILGRE